jgi:hypothetical protein
MTITIAFDVETEGKRAKGDIEWNGSRREILNAMRFVEERAVAGGVTPEALVHSVYAHLPTMGLREKRTERDFQGSVMVYGVVRYANEHAAEMPTYSLVDLVEEQDITAKVTVRGNELSMVISGTPQVSGHA